MILRHILAICFLLPMTGHAATYYVSPTGSNSNNGSSTSPYQTIQRCTQAPTAPGDTCIVRAGTYTNANQGVDATLAVWISPSRGSVAGTAAAPITLKSEVPLGAVIKMGGVNGTNTGITVSLPYWIIEGFEFTTQGMTQSSGTSVATTAITVGGVAHDVIIRRNYMHDIARDMCSNSSFGQGAILINNGVLGTVIEYNVIANIGRLLLGQNGCGYDRYQHDHGIYNAGGDYTTVRYNVFYNNDRGLSYVDYASGTNHINNIIEHNTFDTGTGFDARQISAIEFCQSTSGIRVRNNVFHNAPHGYAVGWCTGTTATDFRFENNVMSGHDQAGTIDGLNAGSMPGSGVTSVNNLFDKTLGFVSTTAGSEDYTLTSSSQAINAGLSTGQSYCGTAPDAGAFEADCVPLSSSVSGSSIEITLAVAFPPVQVPSSTGWTVNCTGTGCPTSTGSLSLKSGTSSVIVIDIGQCSATATYTVTYSNTTGSATDSTNIGWVYNQKIPSFTAFSVTNNCSGSPPTPPTGFRAYYPLDGNGEDASGNGNDSIVTGGTFVPARYGQGFKTTSGLSEYFTIPYGNGVNIGTQSFTLAMAINVPASDVGLVKNYMGTDAGNGLQRLYILSRDNTWGVVVQDDGAGWTASDLTVEPGWNLIVLRVDASTNTATLCKNGYTGTSGNAVNTYTDHVLPSHLRVGLPVGFSTPSTPNATYDEVRIWTTLESCADIWAAWEPPVTQPGTHSQVAHRFQYVYTDESGNPVNLGTTINQSQIVTRSGGVAIEFQIDCANITDCTSASYRLWYSFDGVNFAQSVPDAGFAAAEGLSMWGDSQDHDLNTGSTTCPLTGSLSCTDGGTIMTARATTPVNLTKNTSYVVRFIIKTAWATWTDFYLQLRHQDGTLLSSYTPTNGAHMIMHDTDASRP